MREPLRSDDTAGSDVSIPIQEENKQVKSGGSSITAKKTKSKKRQPESKKEVSGEDRRASFSISRPPDEDCREKKKS